jgi:ABC-type uncharacterized transport system involved in gliding motility auxiliary subunit
VALSAGLFALLQLLANAHNVRFDMTPTQAFVLSDAARQVAAGLKDEVRIIIFYNSQEAGRRREMADLLDQFHAASTLIRHRLLDLDRSPGLAQKYGVASYNTGVLEGGGQALPLKDIDEQDITSALLKLSRPGNRTICFLTGHGERSPESTDERAGYSEVARSLGRENFAIRTLATIPVDGVPPDCAIVIVAGAVHDFLPNEAPLLESHVRTGGLLIVLIDPGAPESITSFLRTFGVEAVDDLIVDEQNRFFGADSFTARIPIFDREAFGGNLDAAGVFPLARSLRPTDETAPDGMRVSLLAMSSPDSWALGGPRAEPDQNVRFRKETDRSGPLPVAVLVTVQPDPEKTGRTRAESGRLVVFGDSDFASNLYLNLLGNKDLFLSTVGLLAAEPELVAVRSKGLPHGTLSPIVLTARQGSMIFWAAVVAQPVAFVLAGIVVVLVRRRRRGGR